MKQLCFSLIVLSIFFVGCNKNNPTEPNAVSDSQLLSKIAGTWSNQYLTIIYDDNGNFQEMVHIITQDYSQSEIIKGTYSIKNEILSYNLASWKILDTTSNSLRKSFSSKDGFYNDKFYGLNTVNNSSNQLLPFESIPNYKIRIEGDLLYFYPLDVLTNINNNNDGIWGNWSTYEWALGSGPNYHNSIILGKLKFRYDFNKDSMTVSFGSKFEIDSSSSYTYQTDTVKYFPPNLSWGKYYNKTVEFHDGQMYLFYKLSKLPTPLKKINN